MGVEALVDPPGGGQRLCMFPCAHGRDMRAWSPLQARPQPFQYASRIHI